MAQVEQETLLSASGQIVPQPLQERYDGFLRVVRLMFVELDEIVAEGDDASDVEWAAWSMDWAGQMGALTELVRARDGVRARVVSGAGPRGSGCAPCGRVPRQRPRTRPMVASHSSGASWR